MYPWVWHCSAWNEVAYIQSASYLLTCWARCLFWTLANDVEESTEPTPDLIARRMPFQEWASYWLPYSVQTEEMEKALSPFRLWLVWVIGSNRRICVSRYVSFASPSHRRGSMHLCWWYTYHNDKGCFVPQESLKPTCYHWSLLGVMKRDEIVSGCHKWSDSIPILAVLNHSLIMYSRSTHLSLTYPLGWWYPQCYGGAYMSRSASCAARCEATNTVKPTEPRLRLHAKYSSFRAWPLYWLPNAVRNRNISRYSWVYRERRSIFTKSSVSR